MTRCLTASARTLSRVPRPRGDDPPSLGTAQREGLRRYHMGVVVPLAHLLEAELTEKFGASVKLQFDGYARDMVSRAQVFAKLAAVEGVSSELALELSGMLADG